jgi:protein SCO1/2
MSPCPTRRDLLVYSALGVLGCSRREPPPEFGTLPPFVLTSQDGKPFGSEELKGQVWAGAFFFTRCPTVCPRLTADMKKVQELAKREAVPLRLVSISVDPAHDTPEVLRAFARERGADLASWTFLTGDPAVIQKTAVDGFKLALEGEPDAGAEHFGLLHGSRLVLVDQTLRIRGYYRPEEAEEQKALVAAARTLSG